MPINTRECCNISSIAVIIKNKWRELGERQESEVEMDTIKNKEKEGDLSLELRKIVTKVKRN